MIKQQKLHFFILSMLTYFSTIFLSHNLVAQDSTAYNKEVRAFLDYHRNQKLDINRWEGFGVAFRLRNKKNNYHEFGLDNLVFDQEIENSSRSGSLTTNQLSVHYQLVYQLIKGDVKLVPIIGGGVLFTYDHSNFKPFYTSNYRRVKTNISGGLTRIIHSAHKSKNQHM